MVVREKEFGDVVGFEEGFDGRGVRVGRTRVDHHVPNGKHPNFGLEDYVVSSHFD